MQGISEWHAKDTPLHSNDYSAVFVTQHYS